MTKIERDADRLVLQSGSTTIVLDKSTREAALHRKILFWTRKPVVTPLASISQVKVESSVDAASKAEICSVLLRLREGGGWRLSARDTKDATATVAAIQEFLGMS